MRKQNIFLATLIFLFVLPCDIHAENEAVIPDIFKKQADSIVVIAVAGKRKKDDRSGSGFFVSSDGVIVTNYHLIKKARRIYVKLRDNTAFSRVKVVNLDVPRDIAVLRIDAKGFKSVKLGNSDKVTIGQRVVAIGNPLGLENTVSDGLVSAIRPSDQGMKLLQISVPLSSGSSGSPLFNLQGEVIGVVAASMSQGQSLNFAIPINEVKPRLVRFLPPEPSPKRIEAEAKTAPKSAVKAKPSSSRVYVIEPNDTLYDLAKRFGTTVEALKKINHLTTSKIITKSGLTRSGTNVL